MFVKTQEFEEFEKDFDLMLKHFRKYTWQIVLGTFLMFIFTSLSIILLP